MSLFRRTKKPSSELYVLTENRKWDDASERCRTHPQDARVSNDIGYLPIHNACFYGAPPSLIRQLHEAYGEGVKTADTYGGWLPLHFACRWGASLEVIEYLVEAYEEGVKTTNMLGKLPLHLACEYGASLEVILYLQAQYPDGSTKKDKDGQTPADLLKKYNNKLSEEDKAKARDILSTTHPVRTSPPRAQPVNHTATQKAVTTTTPVDVPNTTTASATTSTSTMTTSSDGPDSHSHGPPSSPTISAIPITTLENVSGGTVLRGGRGTSDGDERTGATEVFAAAVTTYARACAKVDAGEAAAADDASDRVRTFAGESDASDRASREDIGRQAPAEGEQSAATITSRGSLQPGDTESSLTTTALPSAWNARGGAAVDHGVDDVFFDAVSGDEDSNSTVPDEHFVTGHARSKLEAMRLVEEFATTVDASQQTSSAAVGVDAAELAARSYSDETSQGMLAPAKGKARQNHRKDGATDRLGRQTQNEAKDAERDVQTTYMVASDSLSRSRKVEDSVLAADREKLAPFFESTRQRSMAPVELSVEFILYCTHEEHKLGEGAFGVVYGGYDEVLRRRFAVKKIKYEIHKGSDDDEIQAARNMLANELKVLNEFQHAHIARLYGFFLTEDLRGEQLLVYELAKRGSLDSFFESEGKRYMLPWQRRVLIALHIASALKFLHEGGGVLEHTCYHRDIKSANICLRADYTAVLIDCGLAKMIPQEDSRDHGWSSSKTSGGQPGTMEYMCPLYASGVAVSDRTDVFAFGIVLLELLTGRLQRRRPYGFYDKYVSKSAGGPGNHSLLVDDVDKAAGSWKSDAQSLYSKLALECIQTTPNDRPTMREAFSRLGAIAQTHCFMTHEEFEDIDRGKPTAALSARTLMDAIRNRRWSEVATGVFRIDSSECAELFFFACRWGPSAAAVRSFLQVDDSIPRKFNDNHEHPLHVLCCFGAEKGVVETFVRLYPRSLTVKSYLTNETPLGLAQTQEWENYKDDQDGVISFLRRESFAQHFDGMTGLPRKPGFDLWAHLQPPGRTNANGVLLYIDLAGFKAVNDIAGHDEGDRIIKKYAYDICRVCKTFESSTQSDVHIEVYRLGGDEFAVVCKFAADPRNVWKNVLEPLATSLSDLNYIDTVDPPRYSTFLRIGCAAGSLSNMDSVSSKADELQAEVKNKIGLERGKCAQLSEIRRQGKTNVSKLCIL